MNDIEQTILNRYFVLQQTVIEWVASPGFFAQAGAVVLATSAAFAIAILMKRYVPAFKELNRSDRFYRIREFFYKSRELVFPLLNILILETAVTIADTVWQQSWLIRLAQSVAVIFLIYSLINRFIKSHGVRSLAKWFGIPIATLHVFGVLDDVTTFLDEISLSAGDIRVSLYVLLRTLIFGSVLFWLGRISNSAGKAAIRRNPALDVGTKEVLAKLFEIAIYVVIFLLLLQVMGVNLTALAVFGGALGVGLGFGLQQIASNFVSGIIILLDRSITIGDHVQLEDGRDGTLRELNMRYGIIETYDGKDILVPNEKFITSTYTNWTHQNTKQRYPLELQVAYSTDLDLLFENIRQICADHPKVLSGEHLPIEERPDAEIASFGDNGINILVEFWMEGVDDGKNRVGADLLYSIWESIKEHDMQIPFPQREVRILNEDVFKSNDEKP
ncbi:MAG: mechanosensitive ion channel family protein [Gammaproteobacteria bacterium]